MMKRNILTAITVCLSLSLYAQVPLGITEYRKMVTDYSNQIKMSRENSQAADQKVRMVRTGYYPSLSASATGNYLTNVPVSFPGLALKNYSYSSQLSLQQNVYTGGAVKNQTAAARIELSISQLGEKMTLENVVYSADLTYWAFAAAQQQLDITSRYVNIVDRLYAIVNTRFEDGYVSRTDLLMVETRLNEARMQNISAEKLYQSSQQNLNTMMGNLRAQEFIASDTIAQPDKIPAAVSLDNVLEIRPEYLIAEKKLELSNRNIRLSRTKYNPQFVVGVQGVYGTSSPNITGNTNLYGVGYASLNVPIFNWSERRHAVNMARSAARSSEWSLLDVKNQINGELSVARSNMEQSQRQVVLSQENLNVALENLELNTFSYSEGKLPILDVLSAQLAWIQSYTAFVTSNYNLKVAVADYNKALGGMAYR